MEAIILAGGKGARLQPLTNKIPKPMLPIRGKPIISYQIELLKKYGIKDIIISIGYLGEVIQNYFKDGKKFGVSIKYAKEPTPLGTGGAIKNCEKFVEENEVIILYGDIFLEMNVEKFINFYNSHDGIGAIVVHETDHPQDSDLVELDEDLRIKKIIGKPKCSEIITSKISKSSVYIFNKKFFRYIPKTKNSFEQDILPELVKKEKVYGYLTDELIKDVGTPERYKKMGGSFELENL